jgi:hypothetical protein
LHIPNFRGTLGNVSNKSLFETTLFTLVNRVPPRLRTFCVFIAVHHLGRAHSLPLLGEVEEGEDREGEDDVEFASWTAEKRASDSVLLASEDEEYERYVKLMKLGTFFLYSAKPAVFGFFLLAMGK